MSTPIALDIPHSLGKAAARERLDRGIGRIGDAIPGGGQVTHSWAGDRMTFSVSALGQTMHCALTVHDSSVHAEVDLPPMLGLFAGKIRDALGRGLPKLLK